MLAVYGGGVDSKSVQVLLNCTEAVVVLTLMIMTVFARPFSWMLSWLRKSN